MSRVHLTGCTRQRRVLLDPDGVVVWTAEGTSLTIEQIERNSVPRNPEKLSESDPDIESADNCREGE